MVVVVVRVKTSVPTARLFLPLPREFEFVGWRDEGVRGKVYIYPEATATAAGAGDSELSSG